MIKFDVQLLPKHQVCCPKHIKNFVWRNDAPTSYIKLLCATISNIMSTNIKIPKFCQFCGQAFVAQTTTTRYCSHKCNSRHYKQIKKEEKIRATLSQQIQNVSSVNPETLQSLQSLQKLPIQTTNFINLRDKEFLSVQEAAILLGASRWTIQRMINRNELKASKIGRRTIIKRTEIDNLFK